MFQKMMTGALIAGGAAGLLAVLLHFAFVQTYILLGERYESGEVVHFQNATHAAADTAHAHADPAVAPTAHEHQPAATGDSALSRDALTVAFTVLIYVAYAMLLTTGFAIAGQFGLRIGAAEGALWGLAGFTAFQLAPAMGLAPELPGTIAADLGARQVWWWSTVVATGAALALLAYGRTLFFAVLGVALLAAPHWIGAPDLGEYFGYAPPEIGAAFSARVLGVGLAVWVALGWLAGRLWTRGAGA